MGLLGSLFSAAADIAKETITETMNQNETEKFIKIMMERDAQNAEANEKLYQDWLTHERSNYFAAKKNTIIHDAFDVLMDSFEDTGKFDFSAVDSLSDELKSSDSYKQEAADVVNLCCEALVKLHQKCCISIRFVMQTIHNLQRFADIVPSIRGLDRHYDAFFPVDNADCSFLTDFDSIAEGLEAAKNDSDNYLAMVGSNSPLSRLAALKDILKSEDYVAAVSNLLFADQEVAPYAGMKKMILCLSMEETDEATALLLDTYCTVIMNYLRLSTAKEKVGKDNPFISASTEQILPIDLLIAQSIKSSKSGSPQEVDTNLDEFLEYYPLICTSSWEDQLFILQKVFAYLKMYSQERKVLEFLVKNNIPRTEQIDRRLNFLKNLNQNDISNAANSIEEFSIARIYLDKDMGDACFVGGANPYIGCERWLKKAAEQNYIYAEELLADKYYEGVYIVKDVKAAIYWYEKAANQGSVYAMYRAGYIYYSEPIDYNKAGQWFSLAAEKGDKDAEEVLRNNLRYNRFTKKWDAVR